MEPPPEMPESVGFATAEPVKTHATATAIGTVLATKSLQLRTELVGVVTAVRFSSGETVRAEDVLVTLDTTVEDAQLASAKAALAIAESTSKRSEQAWKAKAISELEYEQSQAAVQQAQAEIDRLEAIIKKKTLTAPFDAKAGLFDLQKGQYLPEGSLITTLQGTERAIHIDFMMPKHVADHLKESELVQLITADGPLAAKIIAIDAQADKVTRNLMARARLDKPPSHLQPNDSVRVEMTYGPPIEGVKIPYTALRNAPTGAFVYVTVPHESEADKKRAQMRPVHPGKSVDGCIVILSGLTPGEEVITDGSFKLRPGVLVEDPKEKEKVEEKGEGPAL